MVMTIGTVVFARSVPISERFNIKEHYATT
jgi:hypothetical protein